MAHLYRKIILLRDRRAPNEQIDISPVSNAAGYSNSVCNPFIYAAVNREFRTPFLEFLVCRWRTVNESVRRRVCREQYGIGVGVSGRAMSISCATTNGIGMQPNGSFYRPSMGRKRSTTISLMPTPTSIVISNGNEFAKAQARPFLAPNSAPLKRRQVSPLPLAMSGFSIGPVQREAAKNKRQSMANALAVQSLPQHYLRRHSGPLIVHQLVQPAPPAPSQVPPSARVTSAAIERPVNGEALSI